MPPIDREFDDTTPEARVARDKVSAATAACEQIQNSWTAAARALSGSVSTNGYGIYHDSHELRSKLCNARDEIDKALKAIAMLQVPTDAEYSLAQ